MKGKVQEKRVNFTFKKKRVSLYLFLTDKRTIFNGQNKILEFFKKRNS